jgi:hypothetical protein
VRLLPRVALRVVENVRPFLGVAERVLMRVRRLRGSATGSENEYKGGN